MPAGSERLQTATGLTPTRRALASFTQVVAFIRARKIHGRGIGWIDAHLLASALVAAVRFWTADGPLRTLADELGIAHRVQGAGA